MNRPRRLTRTPSHLRSSLKTKFKIWRYAKSVSSEKKTVKNAFGIDEKRFFLTHSPNGRLGSSGRFASSAATFASSSAVASSRRSVPITMSALYDLETNIEEVDDHTDRQRAGQIEQHPDHEYLERSARLVEDRLTYLNHIAVSDGNRK